MDDECATVMNPGHPSSEYEIVVHSSAAVRLGVEAESHLERCGAFIHHDVIDAFAHVEAQCVSSRCTGQRTTFH
ncbi:MAG: hypothetical protein JRH11_10975 [Deltaproteobacteria bacterium]|nr:hypothetical protein [Deltaproteobacteria bacterium]